jgi:uncharacterized membrane protein
MDWNMTNTTVFLVLFTIVFVLMDEYLAKPYRRRRIEELKKRDPEMRRILDRAVEEHRNAGN